MSNTIVPHRPPDPIDDEQQQEADLRDKYSFENEEIVIVFRDEPPIRHNVFPDSDDERNEADEPVNPDENPDEEVSRGSGILFKGQKFFSVAAFKEAVLNHALRGGRNIKQVRWDTNKFSFECVGGNCNWRVYCSVGKGSVYWEVKIYNDKHSCVPNGECSMLMVTAIARLFVDKIRTEPEYFLPQRIEELIKQKWKITVSRPQCQHARNMALKWIEKEHDEQFRRLRDYGAELLVSNPNSTVCVETTTNGKGLDEFNRFYVCFEGLKRTWKQCCRRLIGVDGCHLKGKMKGQFLVALGRDGNNAIYPIAWAVVQIENNDNWIWFIQKIQADLELNDGEDFVMVSDRQKGLMSAVETELPRIEHRMCVRHIYANLKARHGKMPELKPLVWTLAWSYNEADYKQNLKRIRDYDLGVYEDVLKTKPNTWCRAFYKIGSCCEDVENNSTESFNATIVKAREKPLVPMLDLVARLAMVRIFKRSVSSNDHESRITPYAKMFLEKEHEDASGCRVFRSTNNMFQVVQGGISYRVCLDQRTCSCRKWDITGIPCEHAYGVILQRNLEVEDFVVNWFSTERWRRTYTDGVIPAQGMKFWPTGTGAPVYKPPEPPQTGRKKKSKKDKRMKGVNESPTKKPKKREMHCGICGEEGHNSRGHNSKKKRGKRQKTGQQSEELSVILSLPPSLEELPAPVQSQGQSQEPSGVVKRGKKAKRGKRRQPSEEFNDIQSQPPSLEELPVQVQTQGPLEGVVV